jgi:gliding motility-associated-like protein
MQKIFLLAVTIVLPFRLFSQNTGGSLEAHIDYEVESRNATNELTSETDTADMIFSAPATINFYGTGGSDAVFYTWFIYKKNDLENPVARYSDQNIRYTFEQSGDYFVRLEVADTDSNMAEDSLSLTITESELDIPNYFSPGDSPGSNDEFRVAYKSLVKFHCAIFNRWGQKLYESNDPSKGWDGCYKGKYVNTGVYYCVIEALGSDGVKYRKSGDINIFRTR